MKPNVINHMPRKLHQLLYEAYHSDKKIKGVNEDIPIENRVSLLMDSLVAKEIGRHDITSGVYTWMNHEGITYVRDIRHELKVLGLIKE